MYSFSDMAMLSYHLDGTRDTEHPGTYKQDVYFDYGVASIPVCYHDGWFFYSSRDGSTHRVRTDGEGDSEVLRNFNPDSISYADGWIFMSRFIDETGQRNCYLTSVNTPNPSTVHITSGMSEATWNALTGDNSGETDDGAGQSDTVAAGKCGENAYWELDDEGILSIYGSGAMNDYNYSRAASPWTDYADSITMAIIGDGITHIGNESFWNCGGLESVFIASTVSEIGNAVFAGCSSLSLVLFLSDSIDSIGWMAFYGCRNLVQITIPAGITKISSSMFENCQSLSSVVIPDTVTLIESEAFEGCTSLSVITVPGGVEIASDAFESTTQVVRSGEERVTVSTVDDRLLYFIENCALTYMDESILDGFDDERCMYARNAVYARSGRKFNSENLRAYFGQFSWYHPTIEPSDFQDSMLNACQRANLALVIEYEEQHGFR